MSGTEVVATWFGTFLLERGRLVREIRAPADPAAWSERLRRRREGRLGPEEERLVSESGAPGLRSRDRRFAPLGVELDRSRGPWPSFDAPSIELLRDLLLHEAEVAIAAARDPTSAIDEAVRSMAEVDRVENLLAERLTSWDQRIGVETETEADGAAPPEAAGDPRLEAARRELRRLRRELHGLRTTLETAVDGAASTTLPNLSALLGPILAARMVSQAGGLERLARLPSSTVQVLGAEKAFFDHLRRGSRPPRHGLLFLHAAIQGAPRKERGRLARALAGKVAIAARLDHAGRPVDPALAAAFDRRKGELARQGTGGRRRRSGPPLDRAALDG